ncbi:MAG TPA: ABC transporter ATP-binding protein [Planctomycetaceae bacterium]|jgi:phospholipid/cholesterol/gamma-HCH transport system ATP-binding protein|nr:ABC transporter ATP-binding protein [Planctomycetaceae bacterium]
MGPISEGTGGGSQPMLEVSALTVTFSGQTVLRNIDLTVPRGETVAVIGESGCGKTVLLKSMVGLVRPSKGKVVFDGQDLSRLDDHQLSKQRIRMGFVFQNAALFDSMTIGQNIAFPLREHTNHRPARIREQVHSVLAEVGLPEEVLKKKPAELSGGMRKRVGVARALVMEPELVFYDEPTTGLDPIMSDVINELMLRTRHRYDVTSVIVTHDMRTARKVADRVVMLYPTTRLDHDQPQVLFDGPPSQLDRTSDKRVAQFVRGEAGERLMELQQGRSGSDG